MKNFNRFVSAAVILVAVGCSKSSSSGPATFVSQATKQAMDMSFDPVAAGDWASYRADEAQTGAGGTDLDGDATADDQVTFALNMATGVETSLNLNATAVHIIGDEFFLVVDELIAGVDLGGAAAATELVLMHWNGLLPEDPAVFVDTLQRSAVPRAVTTVERVYYVNDAAPGAGDTNMHFLDVTAPTTPVTVTAATGTLSAARIMGEREGLVMLRFDETVEGDLDGDADGTDNFVLGLLDGTDAAAQVVMTTITMRGVSTPFDAEALDLMDDGVADEGWLIGVLADELTIGTDLNDPALFDAAWRPGQCAASADGDTTDEVLFYMYFDHPTFATTAVNTGLVGRNRVHVVDGGFVATISPEGEANCDLNQDADSGDLIPRWCAAVDPALGSMGIFPPTATSVMDAVAASPAGGSFGLVKMEGNLIALVDEATDNTDHNADSLKTAQLIAYVDDLDTDMAWEYNLLEPEGGTVIIGAEWLGAEPSLNRIGIGLEESVSDLNLNNGCGITPKDADKIDAVAAWLHFEGGGLGVPGIGFSVQPFNAGVSFAGGNVFFNVDEFSDDSDYNGDGDKSDQVLVRNALGGGGCEPKLMGSMTSASGNALVATSLRGSLFIGDEADAKFDFNGDGDKVDNVVRWIRFN